MQECFRREVARHLKQKLKEWWDSVEKDIMEDWTVVSGFLIILGILFWLVIVLIKINL